MVLNKGYMRYLPGVVLMSFLGCFFAFAYWGHLAHAEDYQMFLFTTDYFKDVVARPGGLVNYIARFFTQFFIHPASGAVVVALLIGSVYYGVLSLFSKMEKDRQWLVVAVAAGLTLLSTTLIIDLTAVFSGTVAIIVTLWVAVLWRSIGEKIRMMLLPLVVFGVFWAVGGSAALALAGFAIVDALVGRKKNVMLWLLIGVSVLIAIVMPFFARSLFGVQMPLQRIIFGADLSRFVAIFDPMAYVLYIVIALLPMVRLVGKVTNPTRWSVGVGLVAVASVAFVLNVSLYNESNLRYCHYARNKQWNNIIELANQKSPTNKVSLIYLNLSLGKMNLLGEKMFHYDQYGVIGLVHPFIIETDISVAMSDVYYELGFINSSERVAFEGMKAVSDYQESVRCVERLAEVSMIKGEYDVAMKYYSYLENTLFYKEKGRKGMESAHRKSIEGNAEWERKRAGIIDQDFFFSENEHDMMLGMLFQSDKNNKLAFDYLMAYCLLNRDVEHYVEYAPIGGHLYSTMPKAFREAYIYYLSLHNPQRLMGNEMSNIDRSYLNRMQQFRNIYVANKNDSRLVQYFSDTYWHYLLR